MNDSIFNLLDRKMIPFKTYYYLLIDISFSIHGSLRVCRVDDTVCNDKNREVLL